MRKFETRNDKRPFNNKKMAQKRKGSHQSISQKVVIHPHPRFPSVYVCRGKDDVLCTKNLIPGSSVYNEKRIVSSDCEYRVWNPYRSKLAAGIVSGIDDIFIKPGMTVLYLGAASGTSVSHVSELCETVYAVEFSQRSGRDLINLAKKRTNIIPIIEDARQPYKYRMIVPMVDVIFSDVAQPDQSRIVALNAKYFLKDGGGVLISIKANCVDSTLPPDQVFANEIDYLKKERLKPKEQVGLEPYEKDHAIVACVYKPQASK